MMPDLAGQLQTAAFAVTRFHLRRLNALGVSWETIGELGCEHHSFGVVRCVPGEGGLYVPGEGELHLVLPIFENGELIDLCAFQSRDHTNWLLRIGCGWALGLEGGFEGHTWADTVPLAVSPLEWLRNGAQGLCVVDWDAPEIFYLTELPHIVCSNEKLAERLLVALTRPQRFPLISIRESRLAA